MLPVTTFSVELLLLAQAIQAHHWGNYLLPAPQTLLQIKAIPRPLVLHHRVVAELRVVGVDDRAMARLHSPPTVAAYTDSGVDEGEGDEAWRFLDAGVGDEGREPLDSPTQCGTIRAGPELKEWRY